MTCEIRHCVVPVWICFPCVCFSKHVVVVRNTSEASLMRVVVDGEQWDITPLKARTWSQADKPVKVSRVEMCDGTVVRTERMEDTDRPCEVYPCACCQCQI